MDESLHEKRERLMRVRDTYNHVSQAMGHGLGVPQYKSPIKTKIEPLSVDSDVQGYIKRLNQSIVVNKQRIPNNSFYKQSRALTSRVNKTKIGFSLDKAVKTPPVLITEQKYVKIPILSEKDSITPERKNKMPSLSPPPTFVVPDEIITDSEAMRNRNRLNRLIYEINEEDREMYNRFAREMNTREKNRKSTMKQRYKDYIDFGLDESTRRSNRDTRIQMLKDERPDLEWWPTLVETFKPETRGLHDLDCLELLSKCKLFNEYEISKVYKVGAYKSPVAKEIYKQTIKTANDFGQFLPTPKLLLAFKIVEDEKVAKQQLKQLSK